jgi:hypothetical protein
MILHHYIKQWKYKNPQLIHMTLQEGLVIKDI